MIEGGIIISSKLTHPSNEWSPIDVIVDGISNFVNFSHFSKHFGPIFISGSFNKYSKISLRSFSNASFNAVV